jgi:wobble nucleotide-excising tRNase
MDNAMSPVFFKTIRFQPLHTTPNLATHLIMDPVKHIEELVRLLNQETENHRITKTLLSQHHSSTQDWERACTNSQAQLHQVLVKLAAAESKNQQLSSENARLNMTINNLVRTVSCFETLLGS